MSGGDDAVASINLLPDNCLAYIFEFLDSSDRKNCSLVCRLWVRIDSHSRQSLSFIDKPFLPNLIFLFTRFDAITTLTFKNIIEDYDLGLISLYCHNLTSLELRDCHKLTDKGMASFALNAKQLKKLKCDSCNFGAKGIKAVIDQCSSLEELFLIDLLGFKTDPLDVIIGPGVAASSLKSICLSGLYSGQCFGPLIKGSKYLKTLMISSVGKKRILRSSCPGGVAWEEIVEVNSEGWDEVLEAAAERATGLVELHLHQIPFGDVILAVFSNCSNLEVLKLTFMVNYTNKNMVFKSIADNCKLLRKLIIEGDDFDMETEDKMGSYEGLIDIAKFCPNLQDLALMRLHLTCLTFRLLVASCHNLERLAFCGPSIGGVTVGNTEIACIAAECNSLKELWIEHYPNITDRGMEVISRGCPNLVKLNVLDCRRVNCPSRYQTDFRRMRRPESSW